ncbi:MAG: Pantothenate kinase type III, CoaX-like, partial [uncultured Acidimicrobiales bacterium]
APRRRRRQHPDRDRALRGPGWQHRARRPLAGGDQRRADGRRAGAAHPGVPGVPRLQLRRRRLRDRHLFGRPPGDRRAAGDGGALLRLRARAARAGHQDGDADPLRQPPRGRRRPHRQRRRGARPARAADHRRRLRHGHDLRRHLRQGRVPGRRHPARHRDQHGRPVLPRCPPAEGRAARAPERDRQDDRRVHPVRRDLRLLVDGRRPRAPHGGRARRLHRPRHRWPGRRHRAVVRHDPARRALAHPPRAAHRLRAQPAM